MNSRAAKHWQTTLFILFSLSGFSGLIYESVWSNYLKSFLGHAAYAQTLVLALFMGGMAIGAWLAGRFMPRITNPLLAYAAIEVAIGLFGLFFHKIFLVATTLLLDTLLPGISAPMATELLRWSFAALLILPQTLLLGATFPLISVGVLRYFPNTPGSSISLLYFSNSIGAVVGVLFSGFVLVGLVGLPGTILTGALINFVLAISVWAISKQLQVGSAQTRQETTEKEPALLRPLLLVAMITGLSSFVYEISWIRMLTMVLGASTHAFELMLSAFILGLALGGLWLRKRIDGYRKPLTALAVIQLLMGLLALCTVLMYNSMFEVMRYLFQSLQNNLNGYFFFNLGSHVIAMSLMLPVTFMAGMTLPLITFVLFRAGGGESAVGKVYAFNTLGAILGVALAAMILLPVVGLKMAVIIGAAMDLILALYLLMRDGARRRWQFAAWLLCLTAVVLTVSAPPFDSTLMASSVFRAGVLPEPGSSKVLLHRDGRTATVDVVLTKGSSLSLVTNGKSDASVSLNPKVRTSPDETTMALLGGMPLLVHPQAKTAAVIGMGTGISAHVMLTSKELEHLDIIEIEDAMVEGAKLFGKFSDRVFLDKRSHIHIDDAKSYFAAHRKQYDVIVSEPSNAWVSGVSSLFTEEFYKRIRKHLKPGGLLVQWLHTYESSPDVVASIFQALSNNFTDYRVYLSNSGDLVIIASPEGSVPPLSDTALAWPDFKKEMARLGWYKMDDVHKHEAGDRKLLDPLFRATGSPANSDFFPYVDQNAVKARFLKANYTLLNNLMDANIPLPGNNFLGNVQVSKEAFAIDFRPRANAQVAPVLASYFSDGDKGKLKDVPSGLHSMVVTLRNKPDCEDEAANLVWLGNLLNLAGLTIPHLPNQKLQPMLTYLKGQVCDHHAARHNRRVLDLMTALAARDIPAIELTAQAILGKGEIGDGVLNDYALQALLLSYYQQDKWGEAQRVLQRAPKSKPIFAQLMRSHVWMRSRPNQ